MIKALEALIGSHSRPRRLLGTLLVSLAMNLIGFGFTYLYFRWSPPYHVHWQLRDFLLWTLSPVVVYEIWVSGRRGRDSAGTS